MKTIKLLIFYLSTSILLYVFFFYLFANIKVNSFPIIHRIADYYFVKGGNTYSKFSEFKTKSNSEIIVLGSSHAYRGYDPRIFKENGYNMFNLGSSGQTMFNTWFIASYYIKKPRLVILDVYEGAFAGDGFESSADLIQNIELDVSAIKIGFSIRDVRGLNMLMLRLANKNKTPYFIDTTYISGGFNETLDSLDRVPEASKPQKIEIPDKQWASFVRILELFKRNEIKLVAVNHPSPNFGNKVNHEKFANKIRDELDKFGYKFYDYAFNLELDAKDNYYDNTHLNQAGVLKFNQTLINDFRKDGVLF